MYSLADLPTPAGSGITLDATKMYVFSGIVDISPNNILMNGAGLKGTDPQKDGVTSSVSGAVLRSTNTSVYMESFAVIPLTGATKAYDFSDSTGTKFCNIFAGCSVIEVGTPSLGVGQISGFEAITYVKNYWNVTKDQIAVCKDCEFRHICTDCRAYVEEPENQYSKPLKCGYNPYTNEWEEWSTNPLKQNAIEYYGMLELIKK